MSDPVINCACVGYRLTGVQQASIFIHFHCMLSPGRVLSFSTCLSWVGTLWLCCAGVESLLRRQNLVIAIIYFSGATMPVLCRQSVAIFSDHNVVNM